MVKASIIGVAILAGVSGAAAAQAPAASTDVEQLRARQQISMLEGVLQRAVQNGVDNLRRKVRAVIPDDALVQGSLPEVRGFRLEGYGVFFDVQVPGLRPSMVWSLRTLNETSGALARDFAQMREFLQLLPDPRVQAEFDRTLRRLQQQMGPVLPPRPDRVAAQGVPAGVQDSPSGTVSAQSVAPPSGAGAPAPPQVDPLLLLDPGEVYTQEVQVALVDAMIEYGHTLVIGPDEWLTIGAKDNEPVNPLTQGDPGVMTIFLSITGSDLAAYRADRLTLDEVRARVRIREN